MLLHIFILNSKEKNKKNERNTQHPISPKNALACVCVPKSVWSLWGTTIFQWEKLALLQFLPNIFSLKSRSTVPKLQSNSRSKSLQKTLSTVSNLQNFLTSKNIIQICWNYYKVPVKRILVSEYYVIPEKSYSTYNFSSKSIFIVS